MIGIGGIGMSAIARYFNDHGVHVSGYDRTPSTLTQQLQKEGISIRFDEDVSQIPIDVDLVVYTPAIPASNTELTFYKNSSIKTYKRAEVLGRIVNQGACYAVAGSHGKSTTSAMLAHVFQIGGKNCTGFLGAIASNYKSNYIAGSADCFVVEADEYDRSFHQIHPSASIITSVDSDHLDIYGNMAGVEKGFQSYISNFRPNGKLFIPDHEKFKEKLNVPFITYGFSEHADYKATQVTRIAGGYEFSVKTPTTEIPNIKLRMGGRYNVENATAVVAMALEYGIESDKIRDAFASFSGLYRRFEIVYETEKLVFIDDYAHHPNEIRSFIQGIKELYPQKRVGAIFQPHLYSRTKDYADHFAKSLDLVDEALVMEIYPAREEPIDGVSSKLITSQMKKNGTEIVTHESVVEKALLMQVDVIVTIGAGNISTAVPKIVEAFKTKQK